MTAPTCRDALAELVAADEALRQASAEMNAAMKPGTSVTYTFPSPAKVRFDAAWAAARSALAQEAVPTGFVLVPTSPTTAMVDAGLAEHDGSAAPEDEMAGAYRAMLAAAPQPPKDHP